MKTVSLSDKEIWFIMDCLGYLSSDDDSGIFIDGRQELLDEIWYKLHRASPRFPEVWYGKLSNRG